MVRNIGGIDRKLRGVLGIWLIVMAVAGAIDDQPEKAVVAGVAGLGLLINWATGFCGGNALSGIDTSELQ